jgi:HAD superfamily hydrolase (TIGR01549 family)
MTPRALIFDCDGTLMDSLGNAVESFHYALERMGEPRSTPDILRYFGVSADRILLNLLQDEARAAQAYEFYRKHQTELAPRTQVYPGIPSLLQRADEAGIPLGIVTGRHRLDLDILLQPHGLLRYFQVIVTDNELAQPKPSPEGLLRALSALRVAAPQSFYIGDSPTDIQAAQAAGVMAVAALWDNKVERQKLLNAKPHYTVQHPDEIWDLLAGS